MHPTTSIRIAFSILIGSVILFLTIPQSAFILLIQNLSNLLSPSSYYTITQSQTELMRADPNFCVRNDDCTSLCAPFDQPGAILTNKYFIETNAGIQLHNTCPASPPNAALYHDRLVCQNNACIAKSLPVNPKKVRSLFAYISRVTRPKVQLPYGE